MMKVVGYYDLRPLDWFSGKRLALSPGEGHICDRCGAEHAVVYVVEDTETGARYSVGSSCAQRSFGFDVSKDAEAKKLVKSAKQKAQEDLDRERQVQVLKLAMQIENDVSHLAIPDFVLDMTSYKGIPCWRCGDGLALVTSGRSDEQARAQALLGWVEHRIHERVPPDWHKVVVLYAENSRSKETITMGRKVAMIARRSWETLLSSNR